MSHLALALSLALAPQAAPRRPNIVLIVADDLGAGDIGPYGQTRIRTPHLDRLAREGMRFDAAYAGSPVCAPSRCVLLTGRHAGHAAIRDNLEVGGWGPDEPEGQAPLPAGEVTLAEHLAAAGYATCAGGKWGLGGPGSEGHPNVQGFEHFFGYLCQRVAHNLYPTHLWRNGAKVQLPGNGAWFSAHQKLAAPLADFAAYEARFAGADYAPARITDELVAWLDAHAAREDAPPFFLYFADPLPHLALQAPRALVESYPAEWDATPYLGEQSYLPHPSPRRAYAAMVEHFDASVGRILAVLDARFLADDTLVIVTSDNGATWVGGVDTAFFGSHAGRRGRKAELFEGGLRVPLLVRWPGRVPEGAVCAAPVASYDLFPTIAAAAGAPVTDAALAARLDGIDLGPTLGDPSAALAREALYFEFAPFRGQAVRAGSWKLMRRTLPRAETPTTSLFHLGADPGESKDVAAAHPEVVARLLAVLEREHTPDPASPIVGVDAPRAR